MCRSCGAIIAAGESQCAVCGATAAGTTASTQAQPAADRETIRFARAILERPYKFTIILLIANLFIFLLMWQSSGMKLSLLQPFNFEVLLAYGAKLNRLINGEREWWRLVTHMFVHVNMLHVLVNMYSLWIVGPYVEKLYGSAKFIVFWVVSGIGASVASYWSVVDSDAQLGALGRFLFSPDKASAGASGALFGLVGVLFVFGIKFRGELPEGFKRAFGTGLLPLILLNLFIGYVGSDIFDNAAHLGGLITGIALASVVEYRRPGERTGVAAVWRALQVTAIAIIALSFVRIAQNFPSELEASATVRETSQRSGPAANFVIYTKSLNEAQEAFAQAVKGDPGKVDQALKSLDSAPHLDQEADKLKEELKALLIEVKNLKAAPSPGSDGPGSPQTSLKELMTRFEAWSNGYTQWLRTTGRTYIGLPGEASPPRKESNSEK